MARLLVVAVALVAVQFLVAWVLTHFGLIVLGACGWWAWSLWQGSARA